MEDWKKISEEFIFWGWCNMIWWMFEMLDGCYVDFDVIGNNIYVIIVVFIFDKEVILVR